LTELKKNIKYNKLEIEQEALRSVSQGAITNELGRFILDRANEISNYAFVTGGNNEFRQALVDESVMRVCDKFLDYYQENKCAASFIIGMIYSTMLNKVKSLNWKDIYGANIKGHIIIVKDGVRVSKLVKYVKDDYLSEIL
jgi:hypothetical protein